MTQNPAPAKLSRAEKASRNVSAAGKKAREITQALEDAIKAEDEAVLKSVISQAKEAGIEKCLGFKRVQNYFFLKKKKNV